MKNRAFKIVLSTRDYINIDSDEIEKVMKSIQSGQPAILKRGILNPSFFVGVIEDDKRMEEHFANTKYSDEDSKRRRLEGPEPLRDIFKEVDISKMLGSGK